MKAIKTQVQILNSPTQNGRLLFEIFNLRHPH
jgi:hypothetical protein